MQYPSCLRSVASPGTFVCSANVQSVCLFHAPGTNARSPYVPFKDFARVDRRFCARHTIAAATDAVPLPSEARTRRLAWWVTECVDRDAPPPGDSGRTPGQASIWSESVRGFICTSSSQLGASKGHGSSRLLIDNILTSPAFSASFTCQSAV